MEGNELLLLKINSYGAKLGKKDAHAQAILADASQLTDKKALEKKVAEIKKLYNTVR
jgi:hypothetical protein